MGRRSRKRPTSPTPSPPPRREVPAPVRAAPRAPAYRARMDEAPKAAWSPFPLTELVLLVAIVLLAIGFFGGGDRRGVLMGCGITLAALAGGELAVREHFAGFRSHSALLAGICAVVAATALWFLGVPQLVVLVVAAAAFAFALVRLRRAFARRSGGLGFRA